MKTILAIIGRCGILLFMLIGPALPTLTANADATKPLYQSPAEKNPQFRKVIERIQIRRPALREFVQRKTVSTIGKTLESSGTLLITPEGVCWSTHKPFPSSMRMTREGIASKRPGKPVSMQRAADSREIEKLVGLMLALFTADESRLSHAFDFFFIGDNSAWTIGFKPSNRELSRVISTVELSGTRDVEKIVIREANGDISEISVVMPPPEASLSLEKCLE